MNFETFYTLSVKDRQKKKKGRYRGNIKPDTNNIAKNSKFAYYLNGSSISMTQSSPYTNKG